MPVSIYILEFTAVALARAIAHHGLAAPGLRQIAEENNTVPGTLLHHFRTKLRLLQLCLPRVAENCDHALLDRVAAYGWSGFIPETEELYPVRVRLAVAELVRTEPALGPILTTLRHDERSAVARLVEGHETLMLDDPRIQACASALVGLWELQCDPSRPLPRETALVIWRTTLLHLLGEEALAD